MKWKYMKRCIFTQCQCRFIFCVCEQNKTKQQYWSSCVFQMYVCERTIGSSAIVVMFRYEHGLHHCAIFLHLLTLFRDLISNL